MKNIHILPTDKPSRIYEFGGTYSLQPKAQENFRSYHIYITSNEEIKEEDWVYHCASNKLFKYDGRGLCVEIEKIILTTDQDLIKDGVQAIDDEFLEWFVKNPSCDEVEVVKESHIEIEEISYEGDFQDVEYIDYKIIIPKEEPKQETPESIIQDIATHLSKTVPETLQHIEEFSKELDKLKSKQETSQDELWGNVFAKIKQYGLNNEVLTILKQNFKISKL